MTLMQLGTAVELYACDENRDKVREQVANGVEILLEQAKEGSDMQLHEHLEEFVLTVFGCNQDLPA